MVNVYILIFMIYVAVKIEVILYLNYLLVLWIRQLVIWLLRGIVKWAFNYAVYY